MRYLLDTNVLSEPIRPRPNEALVQRLRSQWGACATPAPVWHELLYGTARLPESHRRRLLEQYVERLGLDVPILPYDQRAAGWHARERARLEALGLPTPYADGQIAAIAVTNDLVLVTANVRDFGPFTSGLLRVENWLSDA